MDVNFISYGATMISYNVEQGQELMDSLFPKVSKCIFPTVSNFGTITNKDTLSILPMNQIHKFVYLGIWFWFAFLAIATSLHFLLFITQTCNNSIRFKMMTKTDNKAINNELKNLLLAGDGSNIQKMGDIVMLNLLLSNIELNSTKEQIVKEICEMHSKIQ